MNNQYILALCLFAFAFFFVGFVFVMMMLSDRLFHRQRFEIDGIEVWALNEKNARRKAAKKLKL